ncbi:MAG TPA: NUDIX domain-containing protein [Pirellulales bacterium]|jgi:predicted NUDIX family NTP pyrophosphohydrolase
MKQSAGLVLFRRKGTQLEILLVHPSGNYNRGKPWSIPKGLPDEGESLVEAAVRETSEEAGISIEKDSAKELKSLGSIDYTRSRKRVHAFAIEAPSDIVPRPANWEVDRAEFLPIDEAKRLIHPDQRPFLKRLQELIDNAE